MSADIPDRLLLPTHDEYLREIHKLDEQMSRGQSPVEYLGRYTDVQSRRSVLMRNFLKVCEQLGAIVEPTDRSTNVPLDPEQNSQKNFVRGAVTGLILANALHAHEGVSVLRAPEALRLYGSSNPNDIAEYKNNLAMQIIEYGWRGVELLGPASQSIVETWESYIALGPDTQRFRTGLGAIAYGASLLHQEVILKRRKADLEAMKHELESVHDLNWDEDLAGLLSSNDDTQGTV